MSVNVDVVSGEIVVEPTTGDIALTLKQTEIKVEAVTADIKVEVAGAPGPVGPPGPAGVSNAAYTAQWRWTSKTTDAATAGQVGNNDSNNQWAATLLNINQQKDDNTDVTAHLALIEVGDRIRVQQKTDGTRWGDYEVLAPGVDMGTWWQFSVQVLGHSAQEPNNSAEAIVTHIMAEAVTGFLPLTGGTLTGPLIAPYVEADAVAANDPPTSPWHLTRRDYVDARTPKITPGLVPPENPAENDIWINTN